MADIHRSNSEDQSTLKRDYTAFMEQYQKFSFLADISKKSHHAMANTIAPINTNTLNVPPAPGNITTPWNNIWVSWNNSFRKMDTEDADQDNSVIASLTK